MPRPAPSDPRLEGWLETQSRADLVRFLTCGSVDDGKSTLIGRLLYETDAVFDDQMAALERDSRALGTQGGNLDFALLLDGLTPEREQKITIDVAYRYFAARGRRFIIADTPGHQQYTRNMVTGASTADCAVILVDARKGVLAQTRRHAYIVAALGIRQAVLAINKMDACDYQESRFREIEAHCLDLAVAVGLEEVTCIPLSALLGDNVVARSSQMPWYAGPTLLDWLTSVRIDADAYCELPFRFPVQWVNRPHLDFRGFSGTVAAGRIRPGDEVVVLPSGVTSRVQSLVALEGEVGEAVAGQAITLTLADEVDVSRGDLIAAASDPPRVADRLEASVIWMSESPLLRGRTYLMRQGTSSVNATVSPLKYKIAMPSLEQVPASHLDLNEIGVCDLELDRPIAFDPYPVNRNLGGFVLIDRQSLSTVGAGLIRHPLRRSNNLRWELIEVGKRERSSIKGQKPCIVWLTGLSGAGKSTIANLVDRKLHALGRHTYVLDGDNIRHGLSKDLGFTDADRVENIRRVAEVGKLMVDAGLIVIASFISPFSQERAMARAHFVDGEFIEVFVDTPLEAAEQRDPKGLYARARRGELENFTGIDSPYERPESPEIHIETSTVSPEAASEIILEELRRRGSLSL